MNVNEICTVGLSYWIKANCPRVEPRYLGGVPFVGGLFKGS